MQSEDVDLVLNLTPPRAHAEISVQALQADKHVYSEKPLATNRGDARTILKIAKERRLRVGSAPDTFLGTALQTGRALLDGGAIGSPVAATAIMFTPGHERWHPDPAFYYQEGAGPMLDMGPYYVTALIALLGPALRVTGSAQVSFPRRLITSNPRRRQGLTIEVEVPTHVAGVVDFASGVVGTIVTSFDVQAEEARIEIFGTAGTLILPDPNRFGGKLVLRPTGAGEAQIIEPSYGFTHESRGIGVADLAAALATGRPHRASDELAFHALDVMLGVEQSSKENRHYEPESTCERPAPLTEAEVEAWLTAH